MKILLAACNAKYIHSNLAIYDLRAYAGAYREQILLKEYTINQGKDEVLGDIYREKPDVVCISCYIWNISYVRELMEDLAKLLPGVPLWAGGPEVSYDAEAFLQTDPWMTGVMKGEGEETFRELAAYYLDGQGTLEEIAGITYRQGSKIRENPWREPLDLSLVPFPYENLELFDHRILYYESSRGCPFSCSYCLSSIDKKLRFRSLELVKRELQFFLDQRVPQVKFVDRTFNCKASHAVAVWKYLLEHDNGVTNFHFEIAADLLGEEELEVISRMRPGLIQLEIGVQSTNRDTIQAIYRVMDFEKVKENVTRIKAMGRVHQHLDLIAGLPFEDYESFHRSFLDVYALRPDQLQLGFLKVLKGSYMHSHAEAYGCCRRSKEPYEVLSTKWLSFDDILKLKMVESMVEVYYNSGQFQNTMENMLPYFSDAFVMYEELGRYYREKGYDTLSHSRLRRYDILLEFLTERIPGTALAKMKEAMLLDLYLRENLKSRPQWAPDHRAYDREAREYIRERGLPKTAHIEVFSQRTLLFDYENREPLYHNAAVKEIHL
ncbi:MAG: B12-binding domain-containing radical SAM protein [Blautia sp.]|jgi:radical SAM superfamily enzyme YgiQ (UPF0313 family)